MPKLIAELAPLSGKYYGSVVKLSVEGDSSRVSAIEVWSNEISTNRNPSEREANQGPNGKFYYKDGEVGNPEDEYEISDDHYETQAGYLIAKRIAEALDGMEI